MGFLLPILTYPQEGHMQFKPRSTPPPRPDELSEIFRLLQECQASTRQLQRMVQPQAQPEQRAISRIEQPQRQADKAGKK